MVLSDHDYIAAATTHTPPHPRIAMDRALMESLPQQGVMAAEVIAHFLPRLIETHNYQPCAGRVQKKGNWDTLNKKVLKRFPKMHIPENVIDAIIV